MLIVANWKMNPETLEKARNLAIEIKNKKRKFGANKIIICPPFIYLIEISKIISQSVKMSLGAQDVFVGDGQSHTGEVSPLMLKSSGVSHVIVGHSEKRSITDTDDMVREKLFGSLESKLKVILCVGEKERNSEVRYFDEVRDQLSSALNKLPKKYIKNLVIAYEPVWAIGKSEAMEPTDLHEMNIFIKRVLTDILKLKEVKIPILYGGSVTKGNAREIIEKGNADGLLIGRESLKVENFLELISSILS